MIFFVQDMEATIVNGNGTETGQITTTVIGGRDGQPKRVLFPRVPLLLFYFPIRKSYFMELDSENPFFLKSSIYILHYLVYICYKGYRVKEYHLY